MQQEKVSFEVEAINGAGDDSGGAPQALVATTNLDGAILSTRRFDVNDFERVLDFGKILPATPADQVLRHCNNSQKNVFEEHLFCLRGCFLFYFHPSSVIRSSDDVQYRDPPLGVIPLERTEVEFPPGGRRVFQEHAKTAGTRGYEFVIKHIPKKGTEDHNKGLRRDEYVVAETLTQRNEWKAVITSRAGGLKRDTTLRPGVAPSLEVRDSVIDAALSVKNDVTRPGGGPGGAGSKSNRQLERNASKLGGSGLLDGDLTSTGVKENKQTADSSFNKEGATFAVNSLAQFAANDNDEAGSIMDNPLLKQFTKLRFRDEEWMDDYLQRHTEKEMLDMIQEIEQTQLMVKRGLRGAVLEQYKYFVEASCEMTIMGTEVTKLRELVDYQASIVEQIKNISFADAYNNDSNNILFDDDGMFFDDDDDDDDDDDEDDEDDDKSDDDRDVIMEDDDDSAASSQSSSSRRRHPRETRSTTSRTTAKAAQQQGNTNALAPPTTTRMEVPEWLLDVTEEISAFLKECRFKEATDLTLKARNEISTLLNQSDHWPNRQLTKRQQTTVRRISMGVENLTTLLGDRIAETLRRKNEALKQTFKRERQDPQYELTPLLSPVSLGDDLMSLHLLIKLGRPNDAATAYSNRRSIQLSESLNERKIANSGSMVTDVPIFALQLSQGFFSCLSTAIEGFMDLFLSSSSAGAGDDPTATTASMTNDGTTGGGGGGAADDYSLGSSGTSSSTRKKVPARALASIVLWCDQELAKFAATFGGSRVLGRLALSPAPRGATSQIVSPATPGGDDASTVASGIVNDAEKNKAMIEMLRDKLGKAEAAGDFSLAGSLRRKLNKAELKERKRKEDEMRQGNKVNSKAMNDRQIALEIASQCVEHALNSASKNLDGIGLPVVPRLAECLKPRLKGCEVEIALLLKEKWGHILIDWIPKPDPSTTSAGGGGSERRSGRARR